MSSPFLRAAAQRPLLCDGAMGTQLQQAGLESGGCGEAWNVEHPERVLAIQRTYVEAGSDCLTTNTFGGSRIMLERHGRAPDVAAINRAGVHIAREALGERDGFVIGDIGPFGGLMEPYGEHGADEVERAFSEQAAALVDAGADAIIVETQTVLDELAIGIAAAREAGAPCVIASLAFDLTRETRELRTMMGTTPEEAAALAVERGADVLALNCGTDLDMALAAEVVRRYRSSCDLPLMAQPNAGQPELDGVEIVYRQTPDEMAADLDALLAAGAAVVGGCCGSTPDHIRRMRQVLDATEAS